MLSTNFLPSFSVPVISAIKSISSYIPSILVLLGMYTTVIPASLTNWNGSSSPTLLCPEAIIISGSNAIILSASGFLKSICGISSDTPSTSAEYLSTPTNLSESPSSTKTSVLDGAVEIIFSTFFGRVNSFPSLSVIVVLVLPHPVNKLNERTAAPTSEIILFVLFIKSLLLIFIY